MIKFKNISYSYNGDESNGIKNINCHIKRGEVIALCGKSGCGKTTVTRLLNGLIPHYFQGALKGEVEIDGQSMTGANLYDFVGKVGSVFQNPRSQFFCVEALDEMAFACENLRVEKKKILEQIEKVSRAFNVESLLDKNLFQLSGGEKQRIACASVAAIEPEIYVLDEPSSNLDIVSIEELKKVVNRLKKLGKTIVISEHRLYWLTALADRFIYMEDGQIQKDFSTDAFMRLSNEQRYELGLRSLNPFDVELSRRQENCEKEVLIEGLKFAYNKTPIIDIESINLPQNMIYGILGDNGAGKSTFAKVFCGLEKKAKGRVCIENKTLLNKRRSQFCYMVMQDVNHQLFTESIEEEIMLSMDEAVDDKEKQVSILLESFDLSEKKDLHPMSLSGGEKQRVAIASAVASSNPFIILDEPTSGLDYKNMKAVSQHIMDMKTDGKTIFIITHDPELLYECCDRVLFLEEGKIAWHKGLTPDTVKIINKKIFKVE
jgi:energy-coupling factor transport system ATP-binding protein